MKSKLTVYDNGTKEWRLPNGLLHREDDPAVEFTNGDKYWYINGEKHRENGPTIEWSDGGEMWYLNDIEYTEQEYKYKIRSIKLKLLL
jgi:hypothetical protein